MWGWLDAGGWHRGIGMGFQGESTFWCDGDFTRRGGVVERCQWGGFDVVRRVSRRGLSLNYGPAAPQRRRRGV